MFVGILGLLSLLSSLVKPGRAIGRHGEEGRLLSALLLVRHFAGALWSGAVYGNSSLVASFPLLLAIASHRLSRPVRRCAHAPTKSRSVGVA